MKPLAEYPFDPPLHLPVADLDAATAVAIAGALSAETALPALIERVVGVAVEVSGAAHGLLLARAGLAAQAVVTDGRISVTLGRGEPGLAPTREVADDGSALDLPLGEHGLLRLEGAPGTFTPRHLALGDANATERTP